MTFGYKRNKDIKCRLAQIRKYFLKKADLLALNTDLNVEIIFKCACLECSII